MELHQKLLMASFPAIFIFFFVRSFFVPGGSPFNDLWWVFSFSVAMAGPSFVKARRLVLGDIFKNFPQKDPIFFDLYQTYIRRIETGLEPWVAALLSSLFYLGLRVAVIWDIPQLFNSALFWFHCVVFTIGFAFFIKTIWLFLAFGYLINRLGIELDIRKEVYFSWELLEKAGRGYAKTSLGAAVISFCLFWMVFSQFQYFVTDLASIPHQIFFMEFIFALSILFPVAYFIIPQWRLHRILVHRKQEIRSLFYAQYLKTERAFLLNPQRDLAQQYLHERQIIQEIDNLPEWPFRLDSVAPVITMVALPITLFIFKEIMVDVLVGLLKR